jgi:hypothetical protein
MKIFEIFIKETEGQIKINPVKIGFRWLYLMPFVNLFLILLSGHFLFLLLNLFCLALLFFIKLNPFFLMTVHTVFLAMFISEIEVFLLKKRGFEMAKIRVARDKDEAILSLFQ